MTDPACKGCGLEVPVDDAGLCKACVIFGGLLDGMADYHSGDPAKFGSRETAEITLKRRNEK